MKKVFVMMALAMMTASASAQLKSGINLNDLDKSVRPADDFYEYACGGWMKANPLPAAYSRYGSFDRLAEDNNKRINGILKELQENTYPAGTVEQKLSDLYKLAMDSARREKEGLAPVMPLIKRLEAAKKKEQLFAIQLEMMPYGESELFGSYIGADEMDAMKNILTVRQGGLTLGQKDYYLENDEATVKIREAFKKHIVRMFQLFGFSKSAAEKKMKNVMKVEMALAKASKSRTELRDPIANYNRMTLSDFQAKYPHLQLEKQMNAKGIKSQYIQELIVGQPAFMEVADKLFASMTAAEYRDVMEWGLIDGSTGYLNDAVRAANFDFYGKVMSGRKEDHPLWRRSTNQVQGVMGEALGRIYVKKYFPASSKERMKTLVENLRVALGERIAAQDWMDDSTKVNALLKLNTFYVKIGYPDRWTDLTNLKIDAKKSYYENMQECARFWQAWQIDHTAGKPVDRDDWFMNPQTVNAYYNPTTNEI
jgi:putative endopeptidase